MAGSKSSSPAAKIVWAAICACIAATVWFNVRDGGPLLDRATRWSAQFKQVVLDVMHTVGGPLEPAHRAPDKTHASGSYEGPRRG